MPQLLLNMPDLPLACGRCHHFGDITGTASIVSPMHVMMVKRFPGAQRETRSVVAREDTVTAVLEELDN